MKNTVFYKSDGTVLSVVSDVGDLTDIKIANFEVEDNYVVDSIDVSDVNHHKVVTHITPMATATKIEKQEEAITRIEKSLMDLTGLVLDDETESKEGEQ